MIGLPGPDPEWLRDQVSKYAAVRERYVLYAAELKSVLEKAAARVAPLSIIQARAKTVASFGQKAILDWAKHPNPVEEFTDLCGARVIAPTRHGVDAMCAFLEGHFEIDRENSVGIEQRLAPTEFGYRSVHYIVSFKPNVFPTADVQVQVSEKVFGLKGEVQVRTVLEHGWADFSHERSYKGAFKVPDAWQRQLLAIAAMLEVADSEFSRIADGLGAYAATYGSYMTKAEIQREIELLETILEHDADDAELAGRIGKLAIAGKQWDKAVKVLGHYREGRHAFILRDLGVATCKQHQEERHGQAYQQGQKYLEQAIALSPRDIDAICSLAGTWKGLDEDKVGSLYRQAFEIDATDPYVLGNHLEWQITHARDLSLVACLGPVIRQSIERCRQQAAVGMSMPWAHYSRGLFHLLLGNPYESLAAYAKAVDVSSAEWMIDTSLRTLERLSAVRRELAGHEWMRRLLMLGLVARFPASPEAAKVRPDLMRLATPKSKPIAGPVVILAGGCDASVERQMEQYRSLLVDSFRGFQGTLIGGGTTAGISGIVGHIQEQYPDAISTLGYVPRLTPAAVSVDTRYREIRLTEGNDFSALEPLQNWIDLIASDISPYDVRLLGVNGGMITAAEYRIALALGAKVAVIEESGREAAKLLSDEDWGTAARLAHLPPEASQLNAFIVRGVPMLPGDIRETIARAVHDLYRRNQAGRKPPDDPAMAEWEALREDLKESNRQQADHFVELLRRIRCSVHPVSDRDIVLMTFTPEEIEFMAELEHERWNQERLKEGWTRGPRDVQNKVSPYLVPWADLPDEIKEYDRETVRQIPQLLAAVGLEVSRAA